MPHRSSQGQPPSCAARRRPPTRSAWRHGWATSRRDRSNRPPRRRIWTCGAFGIDRRPSSSARGRSTHVIRGRTLGLGHGLDLRLVSRTSTQSGRIFLANDVLGRPRRQVNAHGTSRRFRTPTRIPRSGRKMYTAQDRVFHGGRARRGPSAHSREKDWQGRRSWLPLRAHEHSSVHRHASLSMSPRKQFKEALATPSPRAAQRAA